MAPWPSGMGICCGGGRDAHLSAVLGKGLEDMAEEDSHGSGMWVVKPPGCGAPLPSPGASRCWDLLVSLG